METITFAKLPTNVEELKAMDGADLKSPYKTAALTVAVLCNYEKDVNETINMLNYIKGPQPMSPYDIQFLRDRLGDKLYLPKSYFNGATPENNYTPTMPYTITVKENPYSFQQEGYATLWMHSGGADSDRQVTLRNKPSTGEWFLWENFLMSGIRIPVAADPWA